MRSFTMALLLCLVPASAMAQDLPTGVTYSHGGVFSGPYRVSADLVQGTLSEASTPPGTRFGNGWNAADIPVTSTVTLTPEETLAIRRIANLVWRYGADKSDPHYSPPDKNRDPNYRAWKRDYREWKQATNNGKIPRSPPPPVEPPVFMAWKPCPIEMDAATSLAIVKGGKTKDFPVNSCISPDVHKLLAMFRCKTHPDEESSCPAR